MKTTKQDLQHWFNRCYVYLFDKQECYNKMKEALDVALGMKVNLLNMKGC